MRSSLSPAGSSLFRACAIYRRLGPMHKRTSIYHSGLILCLVGAVCVWLLSSCASTVIVPSGGPQSGAPTVPSAPGGPQSGAPTVPAVPGAPTVPAVPGGPQSGAPTVLAVPGGATVTPRPVATPTPIRVSPSPSATPTPVPPSPSATPTPVPSGVCNENTGSGCDHNDPYTTTNLEGISCGTQA